MAETSTWLADRAVIRVGGAEAREFLQGLVTQDVAQVAPDRPQWSGLLTPQGKALFDFVLWGDPYQPDAILIDAQAEQAEALVRRLALYRLRRAVTIEPVAMGVHWSPDAGTGIADPRLADLGHRWLGPASGSDASDDWRRFRLALGVPEGAAELGAGETLWLEANGRELNGVSFAKGCYVGQENTARMHHRGKVNRRLIVARDAADGERIRTRYPDLSYAVVLRRVEALGDAIIGDWLGRALEGTPASVSVP